MKKRKSLDFNLKPFCPRCGSLEVEINKIGAIICKNCGCETFFDEKSNTLYQKIKVRDRLK